jgi:hypothetical protein
MQVLEPADIGADRAPPRLDAAMVRIDGLVKRACRTVWIFEEERIKGAPLQQMHRFGFSKIKRPQNSGLRGDCMRRPLILRTGVYNE